ncbi:MAG: hypothetical protein AAGF22_03665 [Pseudomonadota bacterium]
MTVENEAELRYLLDQARKAGMTEEEVAVQRMSFAYGNAAFENPDITKEMVKEEAEKLAAS